MTKQTRLYIAGPMSGLPNLNHPAFNAAAQALRDAGYDVVNPVDLNPPPPANYLQLSDAERRGLWRECMRRDITGLMTCDNVALLDDWTYSEGAAIEVTTAEALDMRPASVQAWLDLAADNATKATPEQAQASTITPIDHTPGRAYMMTTTAITVHHHRKSPVFGESAIVVSLDDEAAGPFIRLTKDDQTICIDTDELPLIQQAAQALLAQAGAQDLGAA